MKKERITSIDILRALALFMICFYHWFSYMGTYIGVVIFFALSGYLVTSGLLQKNFSAWKFIKRRMEKIYPSLIVVVMVSSVVVFFINGGLEWKYKMSAFASIAGLNNIYQIVSKMSYFDTKIGRQFSTLPGIVSKLKEQDGIKTALVVHLGTNGKFKEEDFDYVVEMADGKDIFIINTVHKDPWEKEVNQLLAEKVEQYRQKRKKIYLIDWYSYAKNERKYFYKDRTHLNDAGQKFYADFITSEIKKHYSEKYSYTN